MSFTLLDSPLGPLTLAAAEGKLTGLTFEGHKGGPLLPPLLPPPSPEDEAVFHEAARQLAEYFSGTRRVFDLPLLLRGPVFHQDVWRQLAAIPFGSSKTYGEVARALGKPGASRAVGAGSAANPISIIIPCHRLVGSTGSLTGYAGGTERKRWLLHHEGATSQQSLFEKA